MNQEGYSEFSLTLVIIGSPNVPFSLGEESRMKFRTAFCAAVLLISAVGLRAQSTSCGLSGGIIPDGRLTTLWSIPASTTYFYGFNGLAGHSYSVDVTQEVEGFSGNGQDESDFVVTLYAPSDTCPGTSSLIYTNITSWDPSGEWANGIRYSFIAPTTALSGSLAYQIQIQNADAGSGHSYRISIVDTTMYNPRWSTFSGFSTQWGFFNTSSTTIAGTLTLYSTTGAVVGSPVSVSLPAHAFTLKTTSGLGVAANQAGSAVFAYVGPPGAVTADAYFLNGSATLIVPSKFEPRAALH
jgi:hypothetical protein